jgi:fibronectin-binding autotransporter adhesin
MITTSTPSRRLRQILGVSAMALAISAGNIGLHAATLTWDADTLTTAAQDGAGNWNTTTNTWWDGVANVTWNNATPDAAIFGAGSGAAGTVTVPSNTTNTVGNITFNAPGSGGYNIAAGSSTTSKLELSGNPTINVASGVFATNLVVLSGNSFTKSGAGTFVLKPGAPNINSGPTVVSEGTLIIGTSSGRLVIPGSLTISNGATTQLGQSQQMADSGTLTVDGGTFDMTSRPETVAGVVLDNNGLINASSSSAILTSSGAFDVRSGTIVAGLAGAGGLTKTTGGTVSFAAGNANTYTGGTLISAGILDTSRSGTGNGIPTGIVTITNTGMLRLSKDNQVSLSATVIVAGGTYELSNHNDNASIVILDNGGQILNGLSNSKTLTVSTNLDFRNGLCASVLGGTANMVKSTAGTVTLTMNNSYSGGTLVSGGILQVGDGSGVNRGTLGSGPVTNDAVILLNHSGSFTLANAFSGTGSMTNLGGTATLTGDNTYTGGTTVSGGTLLVNNTTGSGTGSGAVQVGSGAILGGTGTVGGIVNVQSGGTLSPGTVNGTLTINGNLTLDAASTSTFDVNGTTPANDSVVLGASVTYGGTLNIVPAGTFTAGQQFVLFSGAGATNAGNFASLAGSPGVNLAFNFTNGVLSVISTAVTPPTLNVAQAGSTLTFSWSEAGYKLIGQTNNLSTGLGTNWGDVPGGATSPVNVDIDPANGAAFFGLTPQ